MLLLKGPAPYTRSHVEIEEPWRTQIGFFSSGCVFPWFAEVDSWLSHGDPVRLGNLWSSLSKSENMWRPYSDVTGMLGSVFWFELMQISSIPSWSAKRLQGAGKSWRVTFIRFFWVSESWKAVSFLVGRPEDSPSNAGILTHHMEVS